MYSGCLSRIYIFRLRFIYYVQRSLLLTHLPRYVTDDGCNLDREQSGKWNRWYKSMLWHELVEPTLQILYYVRRWKGFRSTTTTIYEQETGLWNIYLACYVIVFNRSFLSWFNQWRSLWEERHCQELVCMYLTAFLWVCLAIYKTTYVLNYYLLLCRYVTEHKHWF